MAPRPYHYKDHKENQPTLKAQFAKSMRTGKLGLAFSAVVVLGGTYGVHEGIEEVISDPWNVSTSPQHETALQSFDQRLLNLKRDYTSYQKLEEQRQTAFSSGGADNFNTLTTQTATADKNLKEKAAKFIDDIVMSGQIGEKEFASYYNALENFPIDRGSFALEPTVSQLQASGRNECHLEKSSAQSASDIQQCMYYKGGSSSDFKLMFPTMIFGVMSFMFTLLGGDGRSANILFEKKFKEMENETKTAKAPAKRKAGKPLQN